MAGFLFLRVRAHRLLLLAALLAVLLTTSVLATLAAFSGSIGDAALRDTLQGREAASAALVVNADTAAPSGPGAAPEGADRAVAAGARRTFDGLPVTVRKLATSGAYALPGAKGATDDDQPDLTHFATLDRSRVRLVSGAWPKATAATGQPVPVALPQEAAARLGLKTGDGLTLTDRVTGTPVRIRVTGVYRVADLTDVYWQLDELHGRGVRTVVFTTYGPLLSDGADLASGRLSSGETSWLATGDFRTVTTGRIGALREAAEHGPKALAADKALSGGAPDVRTALPAVLDRTQRALLVSRSTLMIVAVQLVLLAGYALLLVARLLSTERAGETELLRARGGSRRRITLLAAAEALLLAVPAALCAPLFAGPLTRLLADRSALTAIGLRLGDTSTAQVWLVAAVVALACAAAVVAPALASPGTPGTRRGRAGTLPAPVRAGADLGLLVIAAVAYWQLDRQTGAGGGALGGDREGDLGIDPLLVAAPALALLAGTVLTLRLLPPAARLAERWAAGGAGLSSALAGWQFSRRPLRGAGPVLLLVLAVAMGVLAIGQGASWERSQDDQADFRTGASVRVLSGGAGDPGDAGVYAGLPGLRDAAPAYRTTTQLSGSRTATVLALDTAHAPGGMLLRGDLGDGDGALLDAIAPVPASAESAAAGPAARPGIIVPDGSRRLELTLRLADTRAADRRSPSGSTPAVTVVLEDRYGFSYRMPVGGLPADGRPHTVTVDLAGTTGGGQSADGVGQGGQGGTPAEPMALTGLELRSDVPAGTRSETHRLSLDRLTAHDAEGAGRPVTVSDSFRWDAGLVKSEAGAAGPAVPLKPEVTGQALLSVDYGTGSDPRPVQIRDDPVEFDVRIEVPRPRPPTVLPGVATDSFLKAAGAKTGQSVDVPVDGGPPLRVKIVRSVRQLPTTGPGSDADPVESGVSAPESDAEDGGALLLDLRAVNQVLAGRQAASLTPTEWWLTAGPGRTEQLADALRARPDIDPAQVLVRNETAGELRHDPLGAGPRSALLAVAAAAAALAAVGFAVSSAGSLRERAAEFSVLHALGTPRRRLARLIALEQGVLIGVSLLVGLALGAVLTRAVVPLVVLTGQATQPVPRVLVELPAGQVGFLLAGVAVLPVLIVAAIALRRVDPALALRHQGGN